MEGTNSIFSLDKKFSLLFNGVDTDDVKYLVSVLKKDGRIERKEEIIRCILKTETKNYDEWRKEMAICAVREILGSDTLQDDAIIRLLAKLMDPNIRKNFLSWCENLNQIRYWPNEYIFREAKRILTEESHNLRVEDGYAHVKDLGLKATSQTHRTDPNVSLDGLRRCEGKQRPVEGKEEETVQLKKKEKEELEVKQIRGARMELSTRGIKHWRQPVKPTKPTPIVLESEKEVQKVEKKKKYKEQKTLPTVNILLIGEQGVGKSTFINAISNYVEYSSLEDANKYGPNVLINTQFTLVNKENKSVTIEADSTYETTKAEHRNENLGNKGESVTQPITHTLLYKLRGKEFNLNLIDTPGLNDIRGQEQDMKHLNKIREHIMDIGQLNAIVFLLEAGQTRMPTQLRHSLNELLTHFDKSSLQNLLFCYTKTRTFGYKVGDAVATLRAFIDEQTNRTGVDIELGRQNVYCFDSECYRYLCMTSQFPECKNVAMDKDLQECWQHNVTEFERLMERIGQMKIYKLANLTDLGKLRKINEVLAISQQNVAQLLLNTEEGTHTVRTKMQNKYKALEMLGKELAAGEATFFYSNPVVYCNSCKKMCCSTSPDVDILHMEKADRDILKIPNFNNQKCCKICRCYYNFHGFLRHSNRKINTNEIQKVFDEITNESKLLEQHLLEREIEQIDLNAEALKVIQLCAEIQVHIKQKSTTNANDIFLLTLSNLTEIEHRKAQSGGDTKVLEQLIKIGKSYEEEFIRISKEVESKSRNMLTEHEITMRLQEMTTFKEIRQLLQEALRELQIS